MSFSRIGDATLSTCVIEPLRRRFRDARITFVVGEIAAGLIEPEVDAVFPYDRRSYGGLRGKLRLVRALRSGRYDLVVDLRDTAYARLLGAPCLSVRDRGRRHAVERYLDVLSRSGIATDGGRPRLHIRDDERASANEWLRAYGIDTTKGPIVGLHPGGDWVYKLWGEHRFAAVGDAVVETHGARILVFAGPGESGLGEATQRAMSSPCVSVDVSSLRQIAALIEACDVYIGNDTGPLHMADAVGTPSVALFEPTDDIRSGPYGDRHRVIRSGLDFGCNPCHPGRRPGGCGRGFCEPLHAIDPGVVAEAAASMLTKRTPRTTQDVV